MKLQKIKFRYAWLILIASCQDSFLETPPYGSTTLTNLARTRYGAEALLIGAYSSLDGIGGCNTCNFYGSAASNWIYGSVVGGDAYKGSEEGDQRGINEIELSSTSVLNLYTEGKWKQSYAAIQRANDAILAFRALQQEVTEKERMMRIAEARFLRAYFHYDLYRVFGHIPYIDETTIDTRVGNQDDVLPRIREDLAFASSHLPGTQSEPGRATKGAAQSYLGIAWMWSKQFDKAKTMFDSVIFTSGRYSLNKKYHENFNADFRNKQESILEVQQSVNDGALGDNGNWGDALNNPQNGAAGCCGFHQPSQNLVNAFKTDANGLPLLDNYDETDVTNDNGMLSSDASFTPYQGNLDPRLDWTVGRRGIPYLDWGKHPGSAWIRKQAWGGPYSPVKNAYHKSQQGYASDGGTWAKGLNSNNLKLLRYADLLLYAAEAEVELGNLDRALYYVNLVRLRASNPDGMVMNGSAPAANYKIEPYPSFADQAYARKAVRFERRLELGMEGHRFFDLVRWGTAAEEKIKYFENESKKQPHLAGAIFEAGTDEYQPIPRKAIDLSYKNGIATLQQNSGY